MQCQSGGWEKVLPDQACLKVPVQLPHQIGIACLPAMHLHVSGRRKAPSPRQKKMSVAATGRVGLRYKVSDAVIEESFVQWISFFS